MDRKFFTEELSKLKTHNAGEGRIIKKNTTFTSDRDNRRKAREAVEKDLLKEIEGSEKKILELIELKIKELFKMKDP